VRRFAEGRPEGADEVRLGNAGDPCEGRHVERLGVGPIHRVAGAEEAAVLLLDGAAHRGSLPYAFRGPRLRVASDRVQCPRRARERAAVIGGALALVAISDLDTHHFGIRTARADEVTTDALPRILQFCRDEHVRMLIARCNAADLPTARAMYSAGFDLMDTLVYADGPLDGPPPQSSGPTVLRPARPDDRAVIEVIARESFTNYFGHYHSDPRLDPVACTEVYVSWALRAFSGEAADATFIGEVDNRIAGFLSARGLGVYRTLVEESVRWCMAAGSKRIGISTVVTNSVSLNIWLGVGLRTRGAAYTFHKWFDDAQ